MKKVLNTILLSFIFGLCMGQDFKTEFDTYFQQGDTVKQMEVLKKWEQKEPKNAELYASYFNYYFTKSRQVKLGFSNEEPMQENFSFQNNSNNTTAVQEIEYYFDPKVLNKGIQKIDRGISLYPNRLDMRFGKIYVYGQIEDWQKFTDEIIATVKYSKKNKNKWTWTNNEKKENGEEYFLSSLQDYQLQLYDADDSRSLDNMKAIAEEILKYYPEHIVSLSNISIYYTQKGNYEKAIEYLLRAEKINPKDIIILLNLADAYKSMAENEEAIKYYKKVIEIADKETIEFAQYQIDLLTN